MFEVDKVDLDEFLCVVFGDMLVSVVVKKVVKVMGFDCSVVYKWVLDLKGGEGL